LPICCHTLLQCVAHPVQEFVIGQMRARFDRNSAVSGFLAFCMYWRSILTPLHQNPFGRIRLCWRAPLQSQFCFLQTWPSWKCFKLFELTLRFSFWFFCWSVSFLPLHCLDKQTTALCPFLALLWQIASRNLQFSGEWEWPQPVHDFKAVLSYHQKNCVFYDLPFVFILRLYHSLWLLPLSLLLPRNFRQLIGRLRATAATSAKRLCELRRMHNYLIADHFINVIKWTLIGLTNKLTLSSNAT